MCGGSAPIAEECCVVVEVVVDFGALAAVALVVVLALDVEFEAEAINCSVPRSTVSARRPSTTNKRKGDAYQCEVPADGRPRPERLAALAVAERLTRRGVVPV